MDKTTSNVTENLLNKQNDNNEEEKDNSLKREQIDVERCESQEKSNAVDPDLSLGDVWPQVWCGVLANGLCLMGGANTGFTAVFLPKLMADPNIEQFSSNEASWIASLASVGFPIGALCSGPLMDKLGRQKSLVVANTLPIIGWILTYMVSTSIWPLYIARVIGGAGAAMAGSVFVYISEISVPKVRNIMMISTGVFFSTGMLFIMVLGSYIEWHTVSLSFIAIGSASFAVTFLLPESPLWLVSFNQSQRRLDRAMKLVKYFNRSQLVCEKECRKLKELYEKRDKSKLVTDDNNSIRKWTEEVGKLFSDAAVRRPMIILLSIIFFWAFSGTFVVLYYSTNIFKAIGSQFSRNFDEYTATIVIGIVQLGMTVVSAVISMKIGRRVLLISSCLGMTATIVSAAICQTFSDSKLDFSKTNQTTSSIPDSYQSEISIINIMTVISLVLYILMGSLAMTNMPWVLVSELLPTKARAIGGSFITVYSSIGLFTVVKISPLLLNYISLSALFFLFGFITFLSAVFLYFKLPETLGKNFQEIERYFMKNSNKKPDRELVDLRAQ